MRSLFVLGAAAVALSACATTPRKTVQSLDPHDRRWSSTECFQARRAAEQFEEHKNGRMVVGLVGNFIIPFAGTAAALAMNHLKDDDREALNQRVRAACVSDPLKGKRVARR